MAAVCWAGILETKGDSLAHKRHPVMTMMQWPRLTDADSIGGAGAFDDDALGSGVSVGFFTW
jgi:hypothetical protein